MSMSFRTLVVRNFSSSAVFARANAWKLPDLSKLPGGFRGKVYNKKNWTDYLKKNTAILDKEAAKKPKYPTSAPPEGWRNDKSLPEYLRHKYALKEKAAAIDLTKTKRLSRSAIEGIKVLHSQYPEELPPEKLAEFFRVPRVTISKILKSKWTPSSEERAAKEAKWAERGKYLRQKILVENRLKQFFETKEKELGMELPYFFRQQLEDYYNVHGMKELEDNFEQLNEARIGKEKGKEGANEPERLLKGLM